MKTILYRDDLDVLRRYWDGSGWTSYINRARRYATEAEAEASLRRMMLDHIHVKPMKVTQ